jgi:hydrogenase maturation protease
MQDLRQQLQHCTRGRVCFVGLGNRDRGDDGFGVRLAEKLRATIESADHERIGRLGSANKGYSRHSTLMEPRRNAAHGVVIAGTTPEAFMGRVAAGVWDHVIFLDAVEVGAGPGSVTLLDAAAISTRFPQVSTHRISLGLLARWVGTNGITRAWLLGAQPASLGPGAGLTTTLETTLNLLSELLGNLMSPARVPSYSICSLPNRRF